MLQVRVGRQASDDVSCPRVVATMQMVLYALAEKRLVDEVQLIHVSQPQRSRNNLRKPVQMKAVELEEHVLGGHDEMVHDLVSSLLQPLHRLGLGLGQVHFLVDDDAFAGDADAASLKVQVHDAHDVDEPRYTKEDDEYHE